MSFEVLPPPGPATSPRRRRGVRREGASLLALGAPMVWLTGGALAVGVVMVIGLLVLVFYQGVATFWPRPLLRLETRGGEIYLGEVVREETYRPPPALLEGLPEPELERVRRLLAAGEGHLRRRLLRTGNYELTGTHFRWVEDHRLARIERPAWGLVVERLAWGRFYGEPRAFLVDGNPRATEPEAIWALFRREHPRARERYRRRRYLEKHVLGVLNAELEAARLAVRKAELEGGRGSSAWQAARRKLAAVEVQVRRRHREVRREIEALERENGRYRMLFLTYDGKRRREVTLRLADIVRAYPANRLGWAEKLGVYLSRWWEFLSDEPREANSEGGVWPAIFGTVLMTLIMSVFVVPFGVLAALYLREYARPGPLVSTVRIAINNLAGVPSIVFGVFGLGFFCYIVGATVDQLLFAERLPNPTYGKGGLLWASLTLALLTLPVVIVATEEALAAVPNSLREGSYACGASKWQTVRRIVLPRALPGIMTGLILAIARGAGEVAPLMLVGAVKLAPHLPVDSIWPYLHPERSFMHLGFHIYDLGFQSQNSEAAKPMVYTTAFLLITIVTVLNLAAIWLRARLRRRFLAGKF